MIAGQQEMKSVCSTMLEKWEIIEPAVQLIQLFQVALVQNTENGFSSAAPTPKWLAPLVLLVDLYEKAAIASRRKAALAAVRSLRI